MENTDKTIQTVTVELNAEQYAFLSDWQKIHETELGIEVPIGALIRKSVDTTMKSHRDKSDKDGRKEDRPSRSPRIGHDRPAFSPRPRSGGFGARGGAPRTGFKPKAPGARGPKFDMAGTKRQKTKTF